MYLRSCCKANTCVVGCCRQGKCGSVGGGCGPVAPLTAGPPHPQGAAQEGADPGMAAQLHPRGSCERLGRRRHRRSDSHSSGNRLRQCRRHPSSGMKLLRNLKLMYHHFSSSSSPPPYSPFSSWHNASPVKPCPPAMTASKAFPATYLSVHLPMPSLATFCFPALSGDLRVL